MVTLLGAEWSSARGGKTNRQGRFRIDKLVPGHPYSVRIYRKVGHLTGGAFADVALRPGEVRDLGDIRIQPPLLAMSGTREGD